MKEYILGKIVPTFKGNWTPSLDYDKLDVVIYGGASYVATTAIRNGEEPTIDDDCWTLVCRGATTQEVLNQFYREAGYVESIDVEADDVEVLINVNGKGTTYSSDIPIPMATTTTAGIIKPIDRERLDKIDFIDDTLMRTSIDLETLKKKVGDGDSQLKERTATIEGFLGIDYTEPEPVEPKPEKPSMFPKDIETTITFFGINQSWVDTGLAMIKPNTENELSVGYNTAYGKRYYMNVPSGSKSVSFNTRVASQSSQIYDATGTKVTGTYFPICCWIDSENKVVKLEAYTKKTQLPTAVEFRNFTYDVPEGATGLYINAWMINGDNNTSIRATFSRTINEGDSYQIALTETRKRAKYIGVNSNANCWADTANYYHLMCSEVVPGAKYLVSANGSQRSLIAFLTTNATTTGSAAAYCEGETELLSIPASTSQSFIAPEDAKYLYIYLSQDNKSKPLSVTELIGDFEEEEPDEPIEKPDIEGTGCKLLDQVNYNTDDLAILRREVEKLKANSNNTPTPVVSNTEALNITMNMFGRIAIMGTSWDSGWIYTASDQNSSSVTNRRDMSWFNLMCKRNNVKNYYNYATSGMWLKPFIYGTDQTHKLSTDTWTSGSLYQNFLSQTTANDLIILAFRGNDEAKHTTEDAKEAYLGTMTDFISYIGDEDNAPDTYYGMYCKLIGAIKQKSPNAKIVFISYTNENETTLRQRYYAAMKEIADYLGVPCLNWHDDEWYRTHVLKAQMWGGHPSACMLAGMSYAFERLLSKTVDDEKYHDFWWTYLGSTTE